MRAHIQLDQSTNQPKPVARARQFFSTTDLQQADLTLKNIEVHIKTAYGKNAPVTALLISLKELAELPRKATYNIQHAYGIKPDLTKVPILKKYLVRAKCLVKARMRHEASNNTPPVTTAVARLGLFPAPIAGSLSAAFLTHQRILTEASNASSPLCDAENNSASDVSNSPSPLQSDSPMMMLAELALRSASPADENASLLFRVK